MEVYEKQIVKFLVGARENIADEKIAKVFFSGGMAAASHQVRCEMSSAQMILNRN